MGVPYPRPVDFFDFSGRFPLALEEGPDFAAVVEAFLAPLLDPAFCEVLDRCFLAAPPVSLPFLVPAAFFFICPGSDFCNRIVSKVSGGFVEPTVKQKSTYLSGLRVFLLKSRRYFC